MNERVNHGGDELAPVIPLFGRREQQMPTPPDNAWVHDDNPEAQTDAEGWWVDPEAMTDVAPASASDTDAIHPGAPIRSLSSAPSAGDADDEAGSRRRHPTSASITLPDTPRAQRPTLMRASELTKPVHERQQQHVPGANSAAATPSTSAPRSAPSAEVGQPANAASKRGRGRLRIVDSSQVETASEQATAEQQREQAEAALLKKLRGKGLSVSEARTYLRGLGFADDIQNDVVDAYLDRRYLDDAVLAEQIVYAGTTRKGQGRRAISLALSQRGIDREVIDAALADLPDDDDERALEYARTKATSLSRLEPEVALRRLMGQLARRGFSGGIAREAAQQALREVGRPRFH